MGLGNRAGSATTFLHSLMHLKISSVFISKTNHKTRKMHHWLHRHTHFKQNIFTKAPLDWKSGSVTTYEENAFEFYNGELDSGFFVAKASADGPRHICWDPLVL